MNLLKNSKLLAVILCLFTLASCTDYGKKVTFEGTKGEVYYKGDGVTEADAKAVGNFLVQQMYFLKDEKARSVQITKDSGRIKARFVVDQKALATIPKADETFGLIGAMMSKTIFNGTPVDVIYTDDSFKDLKTIPYQATAEAAVNTAEELKLMQRKDHKNNTMYYSKDVNAADANRIFDYLNTSGFFTDDGNNDLIVEKTMTDSFHIRFPVKTSFTDEAGLQKIDDFGKQLKQDVFPSNNLEFEVVDENMNHVKTFSY